MAELFIFPSLVEGFGIPPLEAMACGTPVVTSNRGSIPEVVGNAAITIDPVCYDDYYHTIIQMLNTPEIKMEFSERGLERAKNFSWDRTANQTLEVYNSI